MLPEKLVTIAQGDFVSMAADLRMLENMGTVNIGLLCEGATHPGGKVLQGAQGPEEELYRRTDMARHMKCYLDNEWPYPLGNVRVDEGKAISVGGVLCYRNSPDFGYGIKAEPVSLTVITAVPSKQPPTSARLYLREEYREDMYYTLRASFDAAVTANCDILVLPDFGCGQAGHPPQEVASVMYKLIYEYKEHFRVIVIAISTESKHNYDMFNKIFSRPESSLLYWNGDYPRSSHPTAPWISGTADKVKEELPEYYDVTGGSGDRGLRSPSAEQEQNPPVPMAEEQDDHQEYPLSPQQLASIIEARILETEDKGEDIIIPPPGIEAKYET